MSLLCRMYRYVATQVYLRQRTGTQPERLSVSGNNKSQIPRAFFGTKAWRTITEGSPIMFLTVFGFRILITFGD